MGSTIDIDDALGKRATISVEPEESATEHAARVRRESGQATLELVKGYVLFFLVIIAIAGVAVIGVYEAIFDPTATPDTKRWAQTVVSALLTGVLSFVLGQRVGKGK